MTTNRQMLTRLPDLAAEAWATWNAPNPGEVTARAVKRVHPPAPTDLAVLDALRPDDKGLLAGLTEAIRIVWEQMPAEDRTGFPDPRGWESPTWATEPGWLLVTLEWWQSSLDAADLGWVEDAIEQAYRTLTQITREIPPARLRCTTCGDVLRPQDGGMLSRCDSGHEHPGPMRLTAVWARKPPQVGAIIEMELGVRQATLRQWKARGKIRPARTDGRIDYWLPWDVIQLAYPGIEDTLIEGA